MSVRRALVGTLLLLAPTFAGAHEVRPGYLELRADADGMVDVLWKLPVLDGRVLPLTPVLPGHCAAVTEPTVRVTRDARIETRRWRCGEAGLEEGRLAVDGLAFTLVDVLVRIERPEAEARTRMLKPSAWEMDLAASDAGAAVGAYLVLGIEHILLGFDHLAFVLGLLVLVHGRWMLVKTITAFTVAHSLTLALATFGVVEAPGATIEAVIALSILMLAVEIVHRDRSGTSLLARAPWAVAFGFGLLHGFGFAGALADVGLPPDAIPLALLLFNVGVEAGQLLFVFALLALAHLGSRQLPRAELAPLAAAYLIGVPAAYWSIDRLAGILARI